MKKTPFLFCLCLLLVANITGAQFAISHAGGIEDIKTSTTYIPMPDTASAIAAKYKDVFRKYWTFSKIQFVNEKDLGNYITETSSFFTFDTWEAETYHGTHFTYIYLELWLPDESFFKKQRNEFKNEYKVPVGQIYMSPDYVTAMNPSSIYTMDYDFGGHFYNWSPGMLKNQLQILTVILNKGKDLDFNSGVDPIDENDIKNLKNETLYVPNNVVGKYNSFNGETSDRDPQDLMSEYKFKYKIISVNDLDTMILDDSKPTYYLEYIRCNAFKFILVINSKTGNIVYSDYESMSYNINSSNIKDIYKAVLNSK